MTKQKSAALSAALRAAEIICDDFMPAKTQVSGGIKREVPTGREQLALDLRRMDRLHKDMSDYLVAFAFNEITLQEFVGAAKKLASRIQKERAGE